MRRVPRGRPGLAGSWERFARWWHRVLSSPSFQRNSARCWATRWLALRRTRAVFDLCAGFVYSRVLQAAVRSNLLEVLAERGPRTVEELSNVLQLSQEATRKLLRATTALQLTAARGDDRYDLGRHGAALLGNPSLRSMLDHQDLLYRDLADPLKVLGGAPTSLRRYWSYDSGPQGPDPETAATYSSLMAESLAPLADDALETGVLRGARSLLDVGGGEGAFLERVHRSDPSIRLHLLERPAVAERARKRLAAAGVGPVDISTADARTDAYPGPVDAVSLVRVLHDHDDPEALAILRRARAALGDGGRLVVVEPMRGIRGTQCVSDVYFNLYLAALGQGRTRSLGELNRLFRAAGFAPGQRIRTLRPHFTQVVVTQPETSAGCEF